MAAAAAAASASLRQTRITILLSLNAVAILVAGALIAGAVTNSSNNAIVAERSDVTDEEAEEAGLLAPVSQFIQGITGGGNSAASSGSSGASSTGGGTAEDGSGSGSSDATVTTGTASTSNGKVEAGKLWSVKSITIYQTADKDICIDDSLPGYSDMYWQTSNTKVIASFYSKARSYLGYADNKCRFPKIVGTGKTTITAGTYDGARRDSIEVTVVAAPVDAWKKEVLRLVNVERKKKGLSNLKWGSYCASAADTRARELTQKYDHTRPNGSKWSTACPIPKGNYAGENLAAGSSTVSPSTVVSAWMNSTDHRKNILSKNFKYLSVGFYYSADSQYKVYWSQYFTSYNSA